MKKYEKPRIVIEYFQLAEQIASCAFDKQGDVFVGDANLLADGYIIFDGDRGCNTTKEEMLDIFADYCDTNGGNDGVKLFYNS